MTRCNVSFGVPGVRSRISRFKSPILAAPVPYTLLLTQQSSTARPGGPVAVPETDMSLPGNTVVRTCMEM